MYLFKSFLARCYRKRNILSVQAEYIHRKRNNQSAVGHSIFVPLSCWIIKWEEVKSNLNFYSRRLGRVIENNICIIFSIIVLLNDIQFLTVSYKMLERMYTWYTLQLIWFILRQSRYLLPFLLKVLTNKMNCVIFH